MRAARRWPGGAAAAASLLTGAAVAITRYAVVQIDPITLALLRYALATACLGIVVAVWRPARAVARRDRLPVLLLGAIFFGLFNWSFNAGLQHVPAARAGAIVSLMPALTLVLAGLRRAEPVTPLKVLGVALAFAGVAVTLLERDASGAGAQALRRGDLWLLNAAVCGAVFNVLSRPYLERCGAVSVSAWAMLGGVALLVPLTLAGGDLPALARVTAGGWLAVIVLAVACSALAFTLWIWALSRGTPTGVSVYFALNPIAAALLGVAFLGEEVPVMVGLGLGLVCAGIVVANRVTPRAVGAGAAP